MTSKLDVTTSAGGAAESKYTHSTTSSTSAYTHGDVDVDRSSIAKDLLLATIQVGDTIKRHPSCAPSIVDLKLLGGVSDEAASKALLGMAPVRMCSIVIILI